MTTDEPGRARPGPRGPGPGRMEPEHAQPGAPQAENAAQPEFAQPESAQPESAQPGGAQPGGAQPGGAQPGGAQPGGAQPLSAPRGSAPPGSAPPAGAQPESAPPGSAQPGGEGHRAAGEPPWPTAPRTQGAAAELPPPWASAQGGGMVVDSPESAARPEGPGAHQVGPGVYQQGPGGYRPGPEAYRPWYGPHPPAVAGGPPGVAGGPPGVAGGPPGMAAEPPAMAGEPLGGPMKRRSPRTGTLVALGLCIAVIAALLGGLIGGYVGSRRALGAASAQAYNPGRTPAAVTNRPPTSIAGIAARILPSVVMIKVNGGTGTGSGFIIDGGYIITNNHVITLDGQVSNAKLQVVFNSGQTAPAKLIGTDPYSDIAVIRPAGYLELVPAAAGQLGQRGSRGPGDRGRLTARACGYGYQRYRERAQPPSPGGRPDGQHIGGLHRLNPDRRADQPGKLGRPARERAGAGGGRELSHSHARHRFG